LPAARLAALLGIDATERVGAGGLADRLRRLISDGRVGVGVTLPPERHLAGTLQVSRGTVTAAYARLRADGWAESRQGAGTWTTLPKRGSGVWGPDDATSAAFDLAHAAPAAPPEVADAFAEAMQALPAALPGHGYYRNGLPELRALVAERYTRQGVATSAEHILITAGAQQAIAFVAALQRRGDRVLVEHPTYPNALAVLRTPGTAIAEAPSPDDDPDAAVLAETIGASTPALAYLMPDVHNPTGAGRTIEGRQRMASASSDARCVAVIDETLRDLRFDGPSAPPFAALAPSAVSIGSLSKSVWGGLRIGWIRARPDLIRRLAVVAVRATMGGPVVEQLAGCRLLDSLDTHLVARRRELRERCDVLLDALAAHLPTWAADRPEGGQALWCRMPAALSTAVAVAAEPRGLLLAPGPLFGTGRAFEDRLRLPYTLPPDRLQAAVALLADVVSHVSDRTGRRPARPVYNQNLDMVA